MYEQLFALVVVVVYTVEPAWLHKWEWLSFAEQRFFFLFVCFSSGQHPRMQQLDHRHQMKGKGKLLTSLKETENVVALMCGVARLTVSCCGTSAEWLFGISVVDYWWKTRLTRGRITAHLKPSPSVEQRWELSAFSVWISSHRHCHSNTFITAWNLWSSALCQTALLFSLHESSMWWERSCFSSTHNTNILWTYWRPLLITSELHDTSVLYPENNGESQQASVCLKALSKRRSLHSWDIPETSRHKIAHIIRQTSLASP